MGKIKIKIKFEMIKRYHSRKTLIFLYAEKHLRFSFTIRPNRSSHLISPLDGIQCPLLADDGNSLLVGKHWCVQV